MLLYEYATSIEKITKGKIKSLDVIEKISQNMGRLRYGDWKKGDERVTYAKKDEHGKITLISVTSEEYKEVCRIKDSFGAHAPTYYEDEDGKVQKVAIVLFDGKQRYKGKKLSGINLKDLSDIRHSIFHEWTHIMEKCIVNTADLQREDIIFSSGEATYINTMVDNSMKMEKFEEYIANVDELLKSNTDVTFGGISTIEINKLRSPNERIMHNDISEGATELISRLVMQAMGVRVKHPDRYASQVSLVRRTFELIGMDTAIAQYLTDSRQLIRTLESKYYGGKDLLHCFNEHVTCLKDTYKSLEGELDRIIEDKRKRKEEMKRIKRKIRRFRRLKAENEDEKKEKFIKELEEDYSTHFSASTRNLLEHALSYSTEKSELERAIDSAFPPRPQIVQKKQDILDVIRNLFKTKEPQIVNVEAEKRKKIDRKLGKRVDNILQYKYDDIKISHIFMQEWGKQAFKKGIDEKRLRRKYQVGTYPLKTKLTKEQVEELTIKFFSDFNPDVGHRVHEIIDGKGKNSDTQNINLRYGKPDEIAAETTGVVFQTDDIEVRVPLYGDLRDLYTMVHEISHTLDAKNGANEARMIYGEVGTQCMERLLDDYLLGMSVDELESYKIDAVVLKDDIRDREISTFFDRLRIIENVGKSNGPEKTASTRYMFAQIFQSQFKKFSRDEKRGKLNEFYKLVLSNDIDNIEKLFGIGLGKIKTGNKSCIDDTMLDFFETFMAQEEQGVQKEIEFMEIEKETSDKDITE